MTEAEVRQKLEFWGYSSKVTYFEKFMVYKRFHVYYDEIVRISSGNGYVRIKGIDFELKIQD